ncbi:MAG: hypothetical protein HY697_00070 [Deltaproteobacteria bacterium]|nr:hypothetical protein [Deltaproteobacteria bacterium]
MEPGPVIITPAFPVWLIVLLSALGLLASLMQYRLLRRRLKPRPALGLSLLRLAALSLLVSLAWNPSLTARKQHRLLPSLAVLVDTSQSMGLPGRGGKGSRLDEARAFLLEGPTPLLPSLSQRFAIQLYRFGESLRPIQAAELAGLTAGGRKGDLGGAVQNLAGKHSLALLLSDGNPEGGGGLPPGLPLIAVPAGSPEEHQDVRIKAVAFPALAFRGRAVSVEVTVKGYGYPNLRLPVLLQEGSKLLAAASVRLSGSPAEATASLSFTPEEIGQRSLTVSVPLQFGEGLRENNTIRLSLKVVRDKIRVLMVSGRPSLSYRFLRAALKGDPAIDLLSFVILRTPSNILNVPLNEQSLIPFPVETLFTKELKDFDLLILDNFPAHLYIRSEHLRQIREFVREGGGLAMIGGPDLADGGRYAGSPLEEVLPARLPGGPDYRRDHPAGVSLSRGGTIHPITRFSAEGNSHLWREMPPLDGLNLLERKGSGTVLLESSDGDLRPILAVSDYGKGRSLVLATDDSWKWYMGMVSGGKGNWAYLRLIDRMIRWLTRDPGMDPVQILLPERKAAVGQEVEWRIQRQAEGSSAGAVSLTVFNPEGLKIASSLKSSGRAGEYLASFLPEKGGAYRVRVETREGLLEEQVIVPGPMEELDGAPDHESLERAAASTGGKALSDRPGLLKEMEAYAEKGEIQVREERRPLWAHWPVLALILLLLSAEWFLRRRWGLV